MASAVENAVYQLGYDTGDSVKNLDAARASAEKLVDTTENLTVTQEKSTTATRTSADAMDKLLGKLDPRIRAEQQLQKTIDQVNRYQQEGIGTTGQAAQAIALAQQKVEKFSAANDNARGGLGLFQGALGGVTKILGAFGIALSVASLVDFGKDALKNAASLDAQAKQVGVSTAGLQAYRAELRENGIAYSETDAVIQRLTRSMGDAETQAGSQRDAFLQLGVTAKDLAGGTESVLPKVAQALLGIQDASRRAQIETVLFGKSGQAIESALHALIQPTSDLIEKQTQLGHVLSQDVTHGADAAANGISSAWERIENRITPKVVVFAGVLADLLDKLSRLGAADPNLITASPTAPRRGLGMFGSGGTVLGGQVMPSTGNAANSNAPNGGFSTQNWDQYLANARTAASLAGLTAVRRAEEQAAIDAANAKLKDGNAVVDSTNHTLIKNVSSYQQAKQVLSDSELKLVESLGHTTAIGKQWDKVKETLKGYLSSLDEEVRVAGESASQRGTELSVIKAAQIVQKERGEQEKNLVQTYDAAVQKLGAANAIEVERRENAKLTAAAELQISQQLDLANTALNAGRNDRDVAVEIEQKKLELGTAYTDQMGQQLRLIQQITDQTRLNDYLQDLQDEVKLAGMSADEREREAAVLQQIRATHGEIKQEQQDQIRGLISTRQETERYRQLVDGIAGSFQNFFENVLENGKASFGDLWKAIQAQFAQMLAWMASQALINPIIIPMVEGIYGLSPGTLGAGGAGGALGQASMLGNLGSLGSAGGLSDALGLGSGGWFNGLGSALGFGTPEVALPGGEVLGGASGGSLGSIFGSTTLGGFLGGAGLGALASSLVFGNKNDASIGGLGGAAAGALAGSILFPGVGTIIGGLIGGLAGGGLGSLTGSSNQGAISNFTNGGLGNTLFKAGGGNNGQLSTQAANTISQALTTLQQAGVNVSLGNITGLSIGSDKSYVYDSAGGKQKLAGGDTTAVVNAVLARILPSASGTTPEAQAVLAKYASQGGITSDNLSQLESDLGAAKNFADSLANLKQSDATLTDAGQKLAAINSQYNQLVDQAQQLGLDISGLTDAKNGAISNLLNSYLAQLDAFTPPTETASQWKQALDVIATAEANATEAANALGSGLDQVQSSADRARSSLTGSFDSQISDAIAKLADPVGEAFDQLIASQQQRLTDAQTVSANIDQVTRLSNLELTQYFSSLTPDQLGLLGQSRGLFGDNTFNTALEAANDIQDLSTSIDGLTSSAQDAAQAAADAANNWASAFDTLTKASKALLISDPSLSPVDQYRNASSQFSSLRTAAFGGDVGAASDIASFASDFLKTSFAYNGSTTAYGSDLNYVQTTLNSLASYSQGQQSLAQQQAASLAQTVTLLGQIKQAISDQSNDTVEELGALRGEVSDLAQQIKNTNLQARMTG